MASAPAALSCPTLALEELITMAGAPSAWRTKTM
jgi:hypothetical protein